MAPGIALSDDPAMRDVLERVVRLQSRAARTLRANGRDSEADRAQQFAARSRLILDDPQATRQMHALTRGLSEISHTNLLLERALGGAMSLIGGDFGNVQICDPANGSLRIAAESGFGSEFLDYFAVVEDDGSACGRAAHQRSQTVIVDVNQDAAFTPHREIAAASRFRAVQSTPVVDPTGRLRGVISTHYRRPHYPSGRDLQLILWYAEYVGAALARQEETSITGYEVSAALLARTADLHDQAAARINNSTWVALTNGNEAQALEIQERARRAQHRARQARQRAHALALRAQNQKAEYPPALSPPPVSAA